MIVFQNKLKPTNILCDITKNMNLKEYIKLLHLDDRELIYCTRKAVNRNMTLHKFLQEVYESLYPMIEAGVIKFID